MNPLLWHPSIERQQASHLYKFKEHISKKYGLIDETFTALHQWSIENNESFWQEVWNDADFIIHEEPARVCDKQKKPGTQWFPGAKLNFAENLLKRRDDAIAIYSADEAGQRRSLTFNELYKEVGRVQKGLMDIGVAKGDRVVGFFPNMMESIIAMLATTSLGAIWSSCSPDFGIKGVLDRFGQIEPSVLFFADQYIYNGKSHSSLEKIIEIKSSLPTLKALVKITYPEGSLNVSEDFSLAWESFGEAADPQFESLPFDHPLYIMYSSGTTGVPKCIVHSAGGTLLAHAKEHRLHGDLKSGDTLFYYTTCGWMMWNWMVSALREGATVVSYEGQPLHPDPGVLFRLIDELEITHFGVSPKYLLSLMKASYQVKENHHLKSLKTIFSTGAPLLAEHMEFVYRSLKQDVQLASISGGTDIIGCFMLGNPLTGVRSGEIQGFGLGLDVQSLNEKGESVIQEKGELVCANAFPNMPISFWQDEDGSKYHKAYFEKFSGYWTHGDYIEITGEGSVIVYGRSDATLNPGGVRIGTAEIYRLVEQLPWVQDSIVVGKAINGDVEVCLFLVVEGELSEERVKECKHLIREGASPRHVPTHIFQVDGIPRTLSGKKVEKAILNIIQGEEITNRDALANPEVLDSFHKIFS